MKTNTELKQKGQRIGAAGGFFNQVMSQNATEPVVGEGATVLLYSDRHAYEVVEVSPNKKTVKIQRYNPKRTDGLGMSDAQSYEYKELTGEVRTLYYKWGSWKTKSETALFTEEARQTYGNFGPKLHEAYKKAGGEYKGAFACTIIPGMTKLKTEWHTLNVIFGVKREYYDFSF